MVPPDELLGRRIPTTLPKTTQSVTIVLGCPSELDGKILFLEHFAGHIDIKLGLSYLSESLEVPCRRLTEKSYQWSYTVEDPACYNTDLPGKMHPLVQ